MRRVCSPFFFSCVPHPCLVPFSFRLNSLSSIPAEISREKQTASSLFINLRLLRCGACCTTHLLTHLHERLLLHPASVVGSCLIYKLEELTGQRFQVKLSPSSHWKFTETRAETPPPPAPMPLEFQTTLPPMPLEFQSNNPPLPRNSKMPPVVWYGYFLESPLNKTQRSPHQRIQNEKVSQVMN